MNYHAVNEDIRFIYSVKINIRWHWVSLTWSAWQRYWIVICTGHVHSSLLANSTIATSTILTIPMRNMGHFKDDFLIETLGNGVEWEDRWVITYGWYTKTHKGDEELVRYVARRTHSSHGGERFKSSSQSKIDLDCRTRVDRDGTATGVWRFSYVAYVRRRRCE